AGPFGRPGPALCTAALQTLVGTEKWSAIDRQSNGEMKTRNAHDHSSHVHTGRARPITVDAGRNPKYRPSSESLDCQFMRKISPSPTTRQPCHFGSGRPRASRSRAPPTGMTATEIVTPVLQPFC